MLSFDFGEELTIFRDSLRKYARTELLPGYIERAMQESYPWEEYRALGKMGILTMGLPEEYGGAGDPDYIAIGIASEEIGYADVGLASAVMMPSMMGKMLVNGGSEEVRNKYMPGLVAGDILIGTGLTEAGAGSDAAGIATVARKVDGGYRLTGEKNSVTRVVHSTASIVFARAPGSERHKGISAFIVDHDLPGIQIGRFRDMGLQSSGRGTLAMDDVFVPDSHLIGQEGHGFALVMSDFDFTRSCIALRCLAAAQASLDETVGYMRQRHTFGKPLSTRQGLTLPLAEHFTKIEAARWLCYRALWLRHQGLPHTSEAAMCKWWGPKVARDAIETCLLIHGHAGWSDELPFQHRFRDVMSFFIGDGTAEIQKLIISREKIGREVMD